MVCGGGGGHRCSPPELLACWCSQLICCSHTAQTCPLYSPLGGGSFSFAYMRRAIVSPHRAEYERGQPAAAEKQKARRPSSSAQWRGLMAGVQHGQSPPAGFMCPNQARDEWGRPILIRLTSWIQAEVSGISDHAAGFIGRGWRRRYRGRGGGVLVVEVGGVKARRGICSSRLPD